MVHVELAVVEVLVVGEVRGELERTLKDAALLRWPRKDCTVLCCEARSVGNYGRNQF
jgi:hypothetical protein